MSKVAVDFVWEDNIGRASWVFPKIKLAKDKLQKHHCCARCKYFVAGTPYDKENDIQYHDSMCSFHHEPIGVIAMACAPLAEWEVV